jgi:site-specific DNA-methyltransferase (adenine-specific)
MIDLPINQIVCGDCLEIMKDWPENSIDACVTDPPYGIGFMGKSWDKSGVTYNIALWREILRVLKPGAHLLSFGGSRTYHRMACAIEAAGFEIRDMVEWIYGSGFPKSLDISKAIDKQAGAKRDVVETRRRSQKANEGWDRPWKHEAMKNAGSTIAEFSVTLPATPEAKQWSGWGTALKPAHEPICLARKPLSEKTIAENVLKWGTGGINIDECRAKGNWQRNTHTIADIRGGNFKTYKGNIDLGRGQKSNRQGRFPANLIHDGSTEASCLFPDSKGQQGRSSDSQRTKVNCYGRFNKNGNYQYEPRGDSGSAARFFYCAKASKSERDAGLDGIEEKQQDERRKEGNPGGDNPRNRGVKFVKNNHPTVKPLALMRYLIRLITPPKGIVLDVFAGSGSTLLAAKMLKLRYIGIDISPQYCKIARHRLKGIDIGTPVKKQRKGQKALLAT